MMTGVKQLWECGDEDLENAASNIMTSVGGDIELVGDDINSLLDQFLNGDNDSFARKEVCK